MVLRCCNNPNSAKPSAKGLARTLGCSFHTRGKLHVSINLASKRRLDEGKYEEPDKTRMYTTKDNFTCLLEKCDF